MLWATNSNLDWLENHRNVAPAWVDCFAWADTVDCFARVDTFRNPKADPSRHALCKKK